MLTGVLTLATVFTALPVTQVQAADSVYTHSDGKTGTVVKVTDSGEEASTFEEGWMKADGVITAYCIQLGETFQSGYKTRKDATERLSVHLGWGYKNTHVAYDEISKSEQDRIYENAKAFAKENKDRYDCGGYIYTGEGQTVTIKEKPESPATPEEPSTPHTEQVLHQKQVTTHHLPLCWL